MRGLVLSAVGRFELQEVTAPIPGPLDAVVGVQASGICGSELGGFLGTDGLRQPGLIFGHEFLGTVLEYGSSVSMAGRLPLGTPVTANPLRSCGRCLLCRGGQPNVCPDRELLGAHVHGSNAELVVVAASSLHPVGALPHPAATVLAEPMACALRAVAQTGVRAGGSALVLGAGPIGLLLLEALRLHGVEHRLVTEPNDDRAAAATASGAVRLSSEGTLVEQVRSITGGLGVDAVFDAVGSPATRLSASRCVRPGGDVCFVGLHSDDTTLAWRDLIRREVRCVTSFAYRPVEFARAVELLGTGQATFSGEIVHAALADGQQWYTALIDGHPAGKVVLHPPSASGHDELAPAGRLATLPTSASGTP